MTSGEQSDIEIPAAVRHAAEAVLDKKGLALKLLYVREVSEFADFFLICSGQSDRQVQAIARGVEERLASEGIKPLHSEGFPQGKWVLLDYGDLIVHVFDEEKREFYRLDRLWADAPRVGEWEEDGGAARDRVAEG
jgi:ribosome-associated protein